MIRIFDLMIGYTRIILFLGVLAFANSGNGQTRDVNGFFPKGSNISYYRSGEHCFVDEPIENSIIVDGVEYQAHVRNYSWGQADTAYFGENDTAYVSYDTKTRKASVVMPKRVELGQKWMEADGSWSYEVIAINERLRTPDKTYKDLW